MTNRPTTAFTLRSKKLGVLIRAVRLSAGKSIEDCAQAIGASRETFESYEFGDASPSLPELEVLAYFLDTSPDTFLRRDVSLPGKRSPSQVDPIQLKKLRQRIIGASLRQARLDVGLTVSDLARQTGLAEEQINSIELGDRPVPLPELESLAAALNRPIKHFEDTKGPIGQWVAQQRASQHFADLPSELQEFIAKPVNRPYLDLARRLSEMSVEKLRSVAEGLLEITL